MKLKFYLIGLGTGIIVTAVIMGVVLGFGGSSGEAMTDEQIMSRARELGMIESTVLMPTNATGDAGNGQSTLTGQNDTAGIQAGQEASQPAPQMEADENPLVITGEELPAEDGTGTGAAGDDAQGTQAGTAAGEGASQGGGIPAATQPQDAGTGVSDANGPGEGAGTGTSAQAAGQEQQPQQGQGVQGTTQGQATDTGTGTGTENTQGAQTGTAGADSSTGAQQAPANDTAAQGVGGSIVVTIPDGQDSYSISEILQTAGVIDSALAFNTYLEQTGKDRFIGAGARLIPRGASYEEVSRIITGR
ncbi:MAG: hypothetical protein IJP92_12155 [Lachnospiraceae bacterium]|nr:hypothetical protein [Lachnospiraceae bacterium]